jgi:hypothetical protein
MVVVPHLGDELARLARVHTKPPAPADRFAFNDW